MSAPGSEKAIGAIAKWARRDEWREERDLVLDAHVGPLLEAADLPMDYLAELLGDAFTTLLGVAFEDFICCDFGPEGRNIVVDYLGRRGFKASEPVRRYLRALQGSVMSAYEVVETTPGSHLILRDVIRGGEPLRVEDRLGSRHAVPGEHIATRLLPINGRTYLSGGVLPLRAEQAEALAEEVRRLRTELSDELERAAGEEGTAAADPVPVGPLEDVLLGELAPLFTHTWLEAMLEDMLGATLEALGVDDLDGALAELGMSDAAEDPGTDPELAVALATPRDALGGKSPMQAVRSKAGRRQLVQWLKYRETCPEGDAGSGPPSERLWQALGIGHLR